MQIVFWGAASLGVLGSALWIVHLIHLLTHRNQIAYLADVAPDEPPGGWPSLAVVIAARDEAATIGPAVRSILAQDYPRFSVIAVDDRSGDETGAILAAIRRGDPRLTVVSITDLPPGWLGKTHALERGAEANEADWLLFTDADVVFAPG